MYGADLVEVYELVHRGRGKDYSAEADTVARHVRAQKPDADSLLDVACGTGAHLRCFQDRFSQVEGLELSDPMRAAAGHLMPGTTVHAGDMRTFDLGRTFDAITCMFGSIGYATTTAELERTLRRFARHLVPGGVVAVDPWWFPETYVDGYVSADVVTVEGQTVARVSHSAREGAASRMAVHYVVAGAASGARHFVEDHLISLFTREQYEASFAAAGFAVEYIEGLHSGRGLFVAALKDTPHRPPREPADATAHELTRPADAASRRRKSGQVNEE
jgi:dTDP-3-amino-3,6-dideoxy-alpha-D-glucopyranose N,N-dimethyltransferase/dTDP-3-amino-3,4,6-trideoxy-alpha-D-glucopyranose N,N-dimethyltransferase